MSDAFVGEIRMFAGNYAPAGWTFCNGALLSISSYETLYSLLGTQYGGNGSTTFGLPDYRGRLPVGMGSGLGLTPRTLASTMGQAAVTMLPENTPAHTHAFWVSTLDATSPAPSLPTDPNKMTFGKFDPAGIITGLYSAGTGTSVNQMLNSGFLDAAQTNSAYAIPHNNLMGSLTVSYIICLSGLYPTRNQ